jgi:hypothetical protein
LPSRAELFWRQSQVLFDGWERDLRRDPRRVRRECALYRRWLNGIDPADDGSRDIRDVLLEMLVEMMIDAELSE